MEIMREKKRHLEDRHIFNVKISSRPKREKGGDRGESM